MQQERQWHRHWRSFADQHSHGVRCQQIWNSTIKAENKQSATNPIGTASTAAAIDIAHNTVSSNDAFFSETVM